MPTTDDQPTDAPPWNGPDRRRVNRDLPAPRILRRARVRSTARRFYPALLEGEVYPILDSHPALFIGPAKPNHVWLDVHGHVTHVHRGALEIVEEEPMMPAI